MRYFISLIAALLIAPSVALSVVLPHKVEGDPRANHYHYQQEEVYHLKLAVDFVTYIEFAEKEVITSAGVGSATSFDVQPVDGSNALSVLPLAQDVKSNLIVATTYKGEKRFYRFYLIEESNGIGHNFTVRFKDTEDANHKHQHDDEKQETFNQKTVGNKPTGEPINTDYQLSGSGNFAPTNVYDDGVHTWVQFPASVKRPAVFAVNNKGQERTINLTVHPNNLIQIHTLSKNFSLRLGDEIVCIRKKPNGN